MTAHQSNIVALARKISVFAEQVGQFYLDTGAAEPSFEPNSAKVPEGEEYGALRTSFNDALNDLALLVNGPVHTLRTLIFTHFDLAAFQTALEFDFFGAVPLGASISVADLAEKVGINQDHVGRVLRLLATHRVFVEIEPDIFGHTSHSVLLAQDSGIRAIAHMQLDDMFRAASSMSDSLRNEVYDYENNAWKSRFGMPSWEYYRENPVKAARFARAMEGFIRLDRQVLELAEGFPWATLPEGGKVVDCGGGSGHASFVLAQMFPTLKFVVQDISTEMMGHEHNQSELDGRVVFMKHDYFEPQPVHGASLYFIRQCIHNWNDTGAIKILKAFVPALERCQAGTPLLINDIILPKLGSIPRSAERELRQLDITMLAALGAKQRNVEDFRKILLQADERYHIVKVHGQGSIGLLEVHLRLSGPA